MANILGQEEITCIITGGAKGADFLAAEYGRRHSLPVVEYAADWSDTSSPDAVIKYHPDGKVYDAYAGMRRNTQVIAAADKVIAFWDGQEKGSGTFDGIKKAKNLGKKISIIKYLLL